MLRVYKHAVTSKTGSTFGSRNRSNAHFSSFISPNGPFASPIMNHPVKQRGIILLNLMVRTRLHANFSRNEPNSGGSFPFLFFPCFYLVVTRSEFQCSILNRIIGGTVCGGTERLKGECSTTHNIRVRNNIINLFNLICSFFFFFS